MEKENWDDYIRGVAEEYGAPYQDVKALFYLLGPSEAYDGFVTMMEDYFG